MTPSSPIDLIARYLEQLCADGRSVATVAQYRRYLQLFVEWTPTPLGELDAKALAEFLASPVALQRRDGTLRHPRTVNAIRTCLRGFTRFLWQTGVTDQDAGRVLRSARVARSRPRQMRPRDLRQLLHTMSLEPAPAALRDTTLVRFLSTTGARLSSALALDGEDLDLAHREARLLRGKGGAEQLVFLTTEVAAALGTLLRGRTSGPVFLAQGARRLSPRQAHRRFKEWLERAGLPGHYSPHSLRHTFATRLYRETEDIGLVQAALGHRSITSTMVYAQVDDERVREAVTRLAH